LKIAFITSSLEPGRDGLGDYTIGFADELLQMGHEVMAVSLRDKFVEMASNAEMQADGGSFPTVRIPEALPWPECIQYAQERLDRFAPEWVSLQFVTYTYHPKGFVNGLAAKLAPLLAGRKLHIMFHEVWRGAQRGATVKERLVGLVQKNLVLSFVKSVKPQNVHTSNLAYQALLRKNGLDAGFLPLISNIPIAENSSGWMDGELAKLGITTSNRKEFCLLGIFGSIPMEWLAEDFLKSILEAFGETDRQILLLTIGAHSIEAEESLLKAAKNLSVKVANFGKQSGERISEFLQSLDYGVATTSWSILGKSGTVAAMLDHGLPILVFRDDVDLNVNDPGSPQFIKMKGNWAKTMLAASKVAPRSTRPDIVRIFVHDLQAGETATAKDAQPYDRAGSRARL
jgi:hypothetical protein